MVPQRADVTATKAQGFRGGIWGTNSCAKSRCSGGRFASGFLILLSRLKGLDFVDAGQRVVEFVETIKKTMFCEWIDVKRMDRAIAKGDGLREEINFDGLIGRFGETGKYSTLFRLATGPAEGRS